MKQAGIIRRTSTAVRAPNRMGTTVKDAAKQNAQTASPMSIVSVWPVLQMVAINLVALHDRVVNRLSRDGGQEQDDQRNGVSPELRWSDETR